MTDEERKIQKSLGTFPKNFCIICHKEFFIDDLMETYPIVTENNNLGPICGICAAAKFCADYLFNPKLEWVRKEVEGKIKEQERKDWIANNQNTIGFGD